MRIARWTAPLIVPFLLAAAATADTPDRADDDRRAQRRTPVVDVFDQCSSAVVNISSTEIIRVQRRGIDRFFDEFFDGAFDMPRRQRQYKRTSVGSGFVLHPDGYIVTNAHVVARTTERKVTFADGSEFDAQVLAMDTNRDLAVLKVDADKSLPALPLGRSDDLMVGETVIAIGNPLGYQHTVTSGVISATDRDLEVSRDKTFQGLIQTDASINPGNSGGPLLNVLGELIGVNTAIRADAQNIGFAISVDQLRELLPDLLDVERRYDIRVGMVVDNLDEPRVMAIDEGSPADRAGVRVGDVLTQVNGRRIAEGVDYYIELIGTSPGSKLELAAQRGRESYSTTVTLGERPKPDGVRLAREKLGLMLEPLPEKIAGQLRLPGNAGLYVTDVQVGGPAYKVGVEPSDVLVAIGRHYVSDMDDVGELLDAIDSGERVDFVLLRMTRRGKMLLNGHLQSR